MAFVQADVFVMNLALMRIGEEPVASVEEANAPVKKAARIVTSFYEATVREVLRILPWNSAIERAEITGVADTTTGYQRRFDLTAQFTSGLVRTLEINGDTLIPYRLEKRALFSSVASPARLRFIGRPVADTWDPILLETVVANLGYKIAYPITGDVQLPQQLLQIFTLNIAIAKQIIAVEDRGDIVDLFGLYQQMYSKLNQVQG